MTKRTFFLCVLLVAAVTPGRDSAEAVSSLSRRRTAPGSSVSARPTPRHLTGQVVTEGDGTPLDGVMIRLDGGVVFGPTASDGWFYIRDVPATGFRLNARRIGYSPRVIEVAPGCDSMVVRLAVEPVALSGVEVSRGQSGDRRGFETAVSLERVSPRQITNAIGAGGDVLRSLQTLPSVAVANDFSSQLYLRGGGPEQNAVLLDGVPVYLPYRVLSALSSFNPLLIEAAALYPGGFGAQYGDRLSGVLDVTYRRGRAGSRRSEAAANTIATHLVTEGPLGNSGTTYIVSARRTHYDLLLNPGAADRTVTYPSFYDLYAKVSGRLGHALYDVFAWYGAEAMNLTRSARDDDRRSFDARLKENSRTGGVGTTLKLAVSPRAIHTVTTAYTSDDRRMNLGGDFDALYTEQRQMAMLHEQSGFRLFPNLALIAGFGGQISRTITGYLAEGLHDTANEERPPDGFDYRPAQSEFGYDHRAAKMFSFAQADFTLSPRWQWSAGARVDRSLAFTGIDISPRITANMRLSDCWTLRGSYGWYYQSPSPDAFVERNYFPDLSAHPELHSEKAIHHVVGVSRDFDDRSVFRLEGYYKRLSDLICDRNDGFFVPFNGARGEAWGAEVYARVTDQPGRGLSGDVSYTLAHTYLHTPYDSYALRYDQRHTLSLNGQVRVGRGWQLAAKYRWGSGFPYTAVVGRQPGVYNPTETPWVPVWGATNGARLPQYSRLDIRLTKALHWGRTAWEAYVEVLNVLNHPNVFRYEWDREYLRKHARYQLPRLPNIGLAVTF